MLEVVRPALRGCALVGAFSLLACTQHERGACPSRLRHAQRRMRAYPADLDAEPCLGLGASSLSGAQPSSSDEASDLWPDFAGFDPEDSDKLFEGSSDDSMDMTPSVPYLEGLSVCETVVEVAELVRPVLPHPNSHHLQTPGVVVPAAPGRQKLL